MSKLIYFAPRVLGVLAILFISMFALDAFAPGLSPGEALLGFAIHLIPSVVLALVLAVAWRFEWVGAALFVATGMSAFVLLRGDLVGNLIVGGPFILVGVLFALSAWWGGNRA